MSHNPTGPSRPLPPHLVLADELRLHHNRACDILHSLKHSLEEQLADHPAVSINSRIMVLEAISTLRKSTVEISMIQDDEMSRFTGRMPSVKAPSESDLARLEALTDVRQ